MLSEPESGWRAGEGAEPVIALRRRLGTAAPQPGERGLRARVRELVFQGATVEVRLRTADGLALIAIQTSAEPSDALRIGAELWCCWQPADCHPLAQAQASKL